MKQFVNPVFQPVDHSVSQTYRRTEQLPKLPQPTGGGELPYEFEKIFSSETDISSRFNDSMIQPFDNQNFYRDQSPKIRGTIDSQYYNNTLSITQVVDQKKYNHEILKYSDDDSLINSSFLGAFNTDQYSKPFQQIDSIYRKLEEPSSIHIAKNTQTLCDEELKAELRDQVQDLWANNKYISPIQVKLPSNSTYYNGTGNFGSQQTNYTSNLNSADSHSTKYNQYPNISQSKQPEKSENYNFIQPTQFIQQPQYSSNLQQNGNGSDENKDQKISPIKSRFISQHMVKPLELKKESKEHLVTKTEATPEKIHSPEGFQSIKITEIVNADPHEQFSSQNSSAQLLPMRHSSFVNQQPAQAASKNKEIYYSQMVIPQNSEKKLQRVVINKVQESNQNSDLYQLPPELQQFSRKVPSPQKIGSPKQPIFSDFSSNRSSQKQIAVPRHQTSPSKQSPTTDKQQQQVLFQQAERAVKFQRTQPKAILPEWHKSQGNDLMENRNQGQFQKTKNDDLQVLCVICEELIPFEQVDVHSVGCLARSKQQAKTQNAHILIDNLNKKLGQLQQNIIIQSKQLESDQLMNSEIIEGISKIISCSSNYRKLKQYNEILAQQYARYSQNFDQKRFIMILNLQRVLAVSQEKQLKLQFLEESHDGTLEDDTYLQSELSRLNKQVELEKNNLEQAKLEHEMFVQIQKQDLENMKYLRAQYLEQNIDNEVLSQINSEWDVRNPDTKTNRVTNSIVSDTQYQRDFDGFPGRRDIGSPTLFVNEDQKKAFYQLAVQIKLNLPHNHPGKNLLLQDTYEKAMALKISKTNWEKFIIDEITNIRW